ncbi:MAG TPA: cytochrome P450 [Solirubrobacteraceae bacterium]|jgi:cytochrome P450|nr:cytochrome P450 [Solirubrobacteraceae bacterium]
MARALRFMRDPLSVLLDCYERFGPVFTLRLAAYKVVFMLGPEANHYMTVSNADNFTWGDSMLREFSAMGGEGLFLIDGEVHDRAREIMAPAFNRSRLLGSIEVMIEETERALDELAPGASFDVYAWSRQLTVQILMCALLGLDPDEDCARTLEIVRCLDQVESYFGSFVGRVMRGPFTPWARLMRAMRELDVLISEQIARRRASGERGPDILSLLLDAGDDNGGRLSDVEIRDHLKTLIFTGQDSTTSTLALMFYEIARHPDIGARLLAEREAELADGRPTASQLLSGELGYLEMVVDETLRRYAPPWIGPRRSRAAFEFAGHGVPGGAHVAYSMLASHHLSEVFADPFYFRPERFSAEGRALLPKGAYVPFGGGRRMCLGVRFAKAQIRAVATLMLSRFNLSLPDDFQLRIGQVPTVSPSGGLPMIVEERTAPRMSVPVTT